MPTMIKNWQMFFQFLQASTHSCMPLDLEQIEEQILMHHDYLLQQISLTVHFDIAL